MAEIDPALEAAYLSGQARPGWPALIAGFAEASARVLAGPGVIRDLAYGPHPRQTVDIVPVLEHVPLKLTGLERSEHAQDTEIAQFLIDQTVSVWSENALEPRAVVVYLHAGYWQARDKSTFACLAPAFAAHGCISVLANYPLCPDATLAELTEATRALVPMLLRRFGRLPIIAAGHSAGAHLAVELALTDWAARGLPERPVAAVLGLSGVYDLAPLVATSLNVKLGLDAATARAASPLHRVSALGCPALFTVGGSETPAFLDQTRLMAAAWARAGHAARVEISGADDHFSLLGTLADRESPLGAAVSELVSAARMAAE